MVRQPLARMPRTRPPLPPCRWIATLSLSTRASTAGPFTDELFQVHEEYVAQLSAALEDMRPILRGIDKREELKGDRAEYETIVADPSRLLARGSSAA